VAALLTIDAVSAAYGRGPRVLNQISLSMNAGDIIGVLGMNGAGKTTLIRTIDGELLPAEGSVSFDGADLRKHSLARRVRNGVVTLPEGHRVLQPLTVQENLELSTLHVSRRKVRRVLDEHLPLVYELFPILKERRNQLAGLLSGGEQQMLSLSRALMSDPKLLLLDEPSLGLAPAIVARIYDVLPTLAARGIAMLIVEQNPLRLKSVCSRIIVLREGNMTAELPAQEVSDEVLQSAYFGIS
jgi:branched-chain amino acid transport system ATP-binding protein